MLKSVDSWHCCWTEFSMSNKVSRSASTHTTNRIRTLRLVQVILFANAFYSVRGSFSAAKISICFLRFLAICVQLPLRPFTSQTRRAMTKATNERWRGKSVWLNDTHSHIFSDGDFLFTSSSSARLHLWWIIALMQQQPHTTWPWMSISINWISSVQHK